MELPNASEILPRSFLRAEGTRRSHSGGERPLEQRHRNEARSSQIRTSVTRESKLSQTEKKVAGEGGRRDGVRERCPCRAGGVRLQGGTSALNTYHPL